MREQYLMIARAALAVQEAVVSDLLTVEAALAEMKDHETGDESPWDSITALVINAHTLHAAAIQALNMSSKALEELCGKLQKAML